jgi:CheY-like chemotaxis protein
MGRPRPRFFTTDIPPACQVLLVGDDRDHRESIAALLRKRGYRTLQAATIDDGYRLASELLPDAALIDVGAAAGHAALHLIDRLRMTGALGSLPIVLLIARPLSDQAEAAARARCDLLVLKPCPPEELIRIIEAVIASTPHRERDTMSESMA